MNTTPVEMYSLQMAREGKEPSRALPVRAYQDPVDHVEFDRGITQGGEMQEQKMDVIDCVLQDWAEWMSRPESPQGYPSRAAGMLAPSWIRDSEELYDAVDAAKLEATDAAIDSLKELSRLAISVRFGLGPAVWRFNEHSSLYEQAKREIAPLLRQRSVI